MPTALLPRRRLSARRASLLVMALTSLLVLDAPVLAAQAPPADAIVGEWWTEEKDGRVEFSRTRDGTYQGVLRYGIRPRKDVHNKDPKRRQRPVVGIVLMWNLHYEDGEYVDGFVYNPEDGDTYRMKAWLTSPRALRVRGFVGISLLGQTQTWTRYR